MGFVQQTQSAFENLIDSPKLTEQLLSRPPYRYILDIVTSVINTTGYLQIEFSSGELEAAIGADKAQKTAFLDKLIAALANDSLGDVKSAKIVAGKDPELTNKMLQVLAQQARANSTTSSAAPAQEEVKPKKSSKSKDGEKLSEGKTKKSKDADKSESKDKKTKERDKSKDDSGSKERSSSKRRESTSKTEKPDDKKKSTSSKSSTSTTKPATNGTADKKTPSSRSSSKDAKDPKSKTSSSTALKEKDKDKDKSKTSSKSSSVKEPKDSSKDNKDKKKSKDADKDKKEKSSTKKKKESKPEPVDIIEDSVTRPAQIIADENEPPRSSSGEKRPSTIDDMAHSPSKTEDSGVLSDLPVSPKAIAPPQPLIPIVDTPPIGRPQTSMGRPGTAAARSAPPKLKKKEVEVVEEQKQNQPLEPTGYIISEDVGGKIDETVDDDFLLEDEAPTNDFREGHDDVTQMLAAGDHGALVQKIIDKKAELEEHAMREDDGADAEVETDFDKEKTKVEGLQGSLQAITRTSFPLAQSFDFAQEQVDSMLMEMEQWRAEIRKSEELLREKQATSMTGAQKLAAVMKQLEFDFRETKKAISAAQGRIFANEQKLAARLSAL